MMQRAKGKAGLPELKTIGNKLNAEQSETMNAVKNYFHFRK